MTLALRKISDKQKIFFMKKKLFYLLIIIFISFKTMSLEVTLTQGTVKPTPIAITDFFSDESDAQKIGKNISRVISDNLERSGLFLPIDKKTADFTRF